MFLSITRIYKYYAIILRKFNEEFIRRRILLDIIRCIS